MKTITGVDACRSRNHAAICFLVLFLLAGADSAHGQFSYSTNSDGTLTITHYTGSGGAVVIPLSANGRTVTVVGYHSFDSLTNVTSVVLPTTVTNIVYEAFSDCGGLTNITIPSGVMQIGHDTFYNCRNLPSITIPASVTSIGWGAFSCCTCLTGIFVNVSNPAYMSLNDVLFDKTEGTLVQCPGGIPGNYVIPSIVTNVADEAFRGCSSLATISASSNLKRIGNYSFESCSSLTSFTIPSTVTSIGGWEFGGCSSLTNSITIPASVTSIGNCAFNDCVNLTRIVVDVSNPAYASAGGILFSKSEDILIVCPCAAAVGDFVMPSSVTSICADAFEGCTNLTSVIISSNLTAIPMDMFSDCTSLTNVNMPSGLLNIGSSSFWGCSSLLSAVIPSGVTNINGAAFVGCRRLSSLVIPSSVRSIGDYAFTGCWGLTSLVISTNLTSIGERVFDSCSSLSSVTIPSSVTNLDYYAFSSCTSLTSVCFLGNAPILASYVFSDDHATVYYLPCTTGWGSTFGGLATVLWKPTITVCSLSSSTNISFSWSGFSGMTGVIDTRTDMVHGAWTPLATGIPLAATNCSTINFGGQSTFFRIRLQ